MTLISRETKGPWMCVPLSQPNKARRALTGSAESTAGAGLAGTETIGGWWLFIVARMINHSWKQMEEAVLCEKNKGSAPLVAFYSAAEKPVLLSLPTGAARLWLLWLSSSFERQIQLNWMSMHCSTQSLILLDFAKGCDSPQLWIFQHAALLCWRWVVI